MFCVSALFFNMDQGVEHSFNSSKTIVHSVISPKSYIGRLFFCGSFLRGEGKAGFSSWAFA